VNAWSGQDARPRDVLAWPSSLGWMMGPWLIFAALLNRGTIALFDGAPTGRPFGEFVAAARVTMLGVVPSIVRAWRSSGCMEGLDWGALRCCSSSGEARRCLHSVLGSDCPGLSFTCGAGQRS
jgi:acetyl-CoA synthetase